MIFTFSVYESFFDALLCFYFFSDAFLISVEGSCIGEAASLSGGDP